MITIEIRFLNGRWHATPWDHHVNEGMVEWPPSPWRFLRALIATWHQRVPELSESQVRTLVERLSEAPLAYRLPKAEQAHTRHYMPLGKIDKKSDRIETTKVIDAFFLVDPEDPLVLFYDIVLDETQQSTLAQLISKMTYFGRAESWAEFKLTETRWKPNAGPGAEQGEPTRVLAPFTAREFEVWRQGMLEGMIRQKQVATATAKKLPVEDVKLSKKELENIQRSIPESLFQAMHLDTVDIQKGGWNLPPGARWIDVRRPRLVAASNPAKISWTRQNARPDVLRFALHSNVLPRWTDVLHIGSAFHSQISKMAVKADLSSQAWSRLTGRTGTNDLSQGHQHLFILPEPSAQKSQKIGSLLLHLPGGFDKELLEFFSRFQSLWANNEDFQEQDLVFLDVEDSSGHHEFSPLCGAGDVWESITPFVATRFNKAKEEFGFPVGSPEHDLIRLLLANGFDQPSKIEAINGVNFGRETLWSSFRTHRRNRDGRRGPHGPKGFRIFFEEPQNGPIALGYGAHFGLGLFKKI